MAFQYGVYQLVFQAVQSAEAGVFPTQLAFSSVQKKLCELQIRLKYMGQDIKCVHTAYKSWCRARIGFRTATYMGLTCSTRQDAPLHPLPLDQTCMQASHRLRRGV